MVHDTQLDTQLDRFTDLLIQPITIKLCMLGGNKWMLVPVFLDLKNWVFRLTWGSLTSQKHKDHYLPHYGTHQCFSFLFANSLNWKLFGTTFDTTYWYKILVQHWNIGTTYTICIVLKCTMHNVQHNWIQHTTYALIQRICGINFWQFAVSCGIIYICGIS